MGPKIAFGFHRRHTEVDVPVFDHAVQFANPTLPSPPNRKEARKIVLPVSNHSVITPVGADSFISVWRTFEVGKSIYRVSQEECARLRKSVPYVKLYRYNPKHLYPKLNGYGDNGHGKVWTSGGSTYCRPSVTPYSSTVHARQRVITS